MRLFKAILFLSFLATPAHAAFTVFSHEYNGALFVDYYNNTYWSKTKISFGPDGSATDVTTLTPFPVIATQSGSWTVLQGNPPWSVSQSGAWTTGRTWTLSSGSDSVSAVQSGTWTVQQGTLPWSVSQSGNWSVRLQDGSGNLITSQTSGSQRAVDIGINVAGVQIDPRTKTVHLTQPSAGSDGTQQIPSIDAYGLQGTINSTGILGLWGKMFRATSNFVSTGSTAERAYLLFRNPNGSGVNCKIRVYGFGAPTGSGNVIYRVYQGPTITANGTAVSAVGNRQTGQTTALCVATTLPTATSNGTLYLAHNVNNTSSDVLEQEDFAKWVEPNNAILVTAQQSLAGGSANIDLEWAEQ